MNSNNPQNSKKIVLEAEILEPEESAAGNGDHGKKGRRIFETQNQTWRVSSYYSNSGCLAPSITFILFLVCTSQFGLLAGMGFCVFHIIIAAIGTAAAARRLMYGLNFNVWNWRLCNWTISFLLVYWLAGGLS